jgi:hypothetical protein
VGNYEGDGQLGETKAEIEDNIRMDLREIK